MSDVTGVPYVSRLSFGPMTEAAANLVAEWHYAAPYDRYDVSADPQDYEEMVTPELWPEIFEMVSAGPQLVGFFTAERAVGHAWEISLAVRPDLTGRGLGTRFIRACLHRLSQLDPSHERVVLTVASDNRRAIRALEKVGFRVTASTQQAGSYGVFRSVRLELERMAQVAA